MQLQVSTDSFQQAFVSISWKLATRRSAWLVSIHDAQVQRRFTFFMRPTACWFCFLPSFFSQGRQSRTMVADRRAGRSNLLLRRRHHIQFAMTDPSAERRLFSSSTPAAFSAKPAKESNQAALISSRILFTVATCPFLKRPGKLQKEF